MAEGAIIAGAGLSAYGQYEAYNQQAEASKQEAKMRRAQAKEIRERLILEEQSLRQTAQEVVAAQSGAFAKGGVALGEGMTLVAMEDTNAKIQTEISTARRDAYFRSGQLEKSAEFEMDASSNYKKAGYIAAGSSLLGGAGQLYNRK